MADLLEEFQLDFGGKRKAAPKKDLSQEFGLELQGQPATDLASEFGLDLPQASWLDTAKSLPERAQLGTSAAIAQTAAMNTAEQQRLLGEADKVVPSFVPGMGGVARNPYTETPVTERVMEEERLKAERAAADLTMSSASTALEKARPEGEGFWQRAVARP